jgi:hypothetical protein
MNIRSGIGIQGIHWEIRIRLSSSKCKERFGLTRTSAAIAMCASGATGTRRAHGLLCPSLKKLRTVDETL